MRKSLFGSRFKRRLDKSLKSDVTAPHYEALKKTMTTSAHRRIVDHKTLRAICELCPSSGSIWLGDQKRPKRTAVVGRFSYQAVAVIKSGLGVSTLPIHRATGVTATA